MFSVPIFFGYGGLGHFRVFCGFLIRGTPREAILDDLVDDPAYDNNTDDDSCNLEFLEHVSSYHHHRSLYTL